MVKLFPTETQISSLQLKQICGVHSAENSLF
jgi:hypothetical protein